MALEDAICLGTAANECDGDLAQAFQRYQDICIVRTARVQISSLMMDRAAWALRTLHGAAGVGRSERLDGRDSIRVTTKASDGEHAKWGNG